MAPLCSDDDIWEMENKRFEWKVASHNIIQSNNVLPG